MEGCFNSDKRIYGRKIFLYFYSCKPVANRVNILGKYQ